MGRISKVLNVVAILIIILAFLTKENNNTRLIELFLGVILMEIAFIYANKRKIRNLILYPIFLLLTLFAIDFGCVFAFKFQPILAKKIISSDSFATYNSLFYRTYNCNKEKYLDLFYKKSDYCSIDNLLEKDINVLSSDIINNFNNYKNKFYVLNAKVSYKEGSDIVELKSYNTDNDDSNMNGNVTFHDNIVYKLKFNNLKNIDDLKLYDNVTIVGRIASKKKVSDNYEITISDAYIPNLKLYDNYDINVVEEKSCQKDKKEYVETKFNKFYTSCLSNIYVLYDKDEVYELNYVLKDERITLDKLLEGYNNKKEQKLEEESKVYELYEYDKYNILICDDNVIIGNKKLDFNNNYCNVKDIDNEEL